MYLLLSCIASTHLTMSLTASHWLLCTLHYLLLLNLTSFYPHTVAQFFTGFSCFFQVVTYITMDLRLLEEHGMGGEALLPVKLLSVKGKQTPYALQPQTRPALNGTITVFPNDSRNCLALVELVVLNSLHTGLIPPRPIYTQVVLNSLHTLAGGLFHLAPFIPRSASRNSWSKNAGDYWKSAYDAWRENAGDSWKFSTVLICSTTE